MDLDDLPIDWQMTIRELRSEAAKYRIERNIARSALADLRTELEAGRRSE